MRSKNIVLFAGWSRSQSSYKKLIDQAPSGWNTFVASYEDLMPAGSIDGFEKRVLAFLEKYRLSEVTLAGHSLGGALAMEFAFHHSEKVEKLYLVDSEGVFGNESLSWIIRNFFSYVCSSWKKEIS